MKRYELNNRVIAITGSTGGLGLAVALERESKTRQSMKESA
jgi:NADP-dependent 3-hydroxy acid dehydrogenase YdfG